MLFTVIFTVLLTICYVIYRAKIKNTKKQKK